jgi:hypothetical protein
MKTVPTTEEAVVDVGYSEEKEELDNSTLEATKSQRLWMTGQNNASRKPYLLEPGSKAKNS